MNYLGMKNLFVIGVVAWKIMLQKFTMLAFLHQTTDILKKILKRWQTYILANLLI